MSKLSKGTFIYFSILVLCIPFISLSAKSDLGSSSEDEQQVVSVTFETPVEATKLKHILGNKDYELSILQSSFKVDDREITDFILIANIVNADETFKTFIESRKAIRDSLVNKKFISIDTETTDNVNSSELYVGSIEIRGYNIDTSIFQNEFPNSKIRVSKLNLKRPKYSKSNPPQEISPREAEGSSSLAAAANTPYYTLVPASGSVTTGTFTTANITSPTRGVVNYMKWSANRFASDQTYEHDFFLLRDSTSPGTYFARSFSLTPWCQPKTVYAATSWPASSHPFIDSDLESNGLCSSSGYIAYSLGAAQADAITTGVDHFTAILMPDGDASTDKFLLQGQVGYQMPAGSHSALNSYPYGYGINETTHYGLIKNGGVPGSQNWTFNGNVPDTPINVSATEPTSSSIKVKFTDITWDETSIIIQRSTGGSSGPWSSYDFGVLNNGNTVGNWVWTNSSLTSKTKYCYRAKAANAKGSSPYSSISCTTTL